MAIDVASKGILLAGVLLAVLSAQVANADVAGQARVIDGDTIVIAGEHVRLQGIDAPEMHQPCTAYGQAWACGRASAEWLGTQVLDRRVECVGHSRDRYGRLIAVCYLGGDDLNARLVREGWALAYRQYSKDYVADEAIAKRDSAGIWRGEFTPPWEWRAAKR